MNGRSQKMGFLVLAVVLSFGMLVASPAFAAKGKTFTGTVSDVMCGASHAIRESPAGTRDPPRRLAASTVRIGHGDVPPLSPNW